MSLGTMRKRCGSWPLHPRRRWKSNSPVEFRRTPSLPGRRMTTRVGQVSRSYGAKLPSPGGRFTILLRQGRNICSKESPRTTTFLPCALWGRMARVRLPWQQIQDEDCPSRDLTAGRLEDDGEQILNRRLPSGPARWKCQPCRLQFRRPGLPEQSDLVPRTYLLPFRIRPQPYSRCVLRTPSPNAERFESRSRRQPE